MSNEALHEAIRAAEEKKVPAKSQKPKQRAVYTVRRNYSSHAKAKADSFTNIRTGATAEPKTKTAQKSKNQKMSDGVKSMKTDPKSLKAALIR